MHHQPPIIKQPGVAPKGFCDEKRLDATFFTYFAKSNTKATQSSYEISEVNPISPTYTLLFCGEGGRQ